MSVTVGLADCLLGQLVSNRSCQHYVPPAISFPARSCYSYSYMPCQPDTIGTCRGRTRTTTCTENDRSQLHLFPHTVSCDLCQPLSSLSSSSCLLLGRARPCPRQTVPPRYRRLLLLFLSYLTTPSFLTVSITTSPKPTAPLPPLPPPPLPLPPTQLSPSLSM